MSNATVTSIASSPANGNALGAGSTVTFTVTMSSAVTVNSAGGMPTLTLNDGRTASYTGGSGTSALTFSYTVQAGDNTYDLLVNGLAVPAGSSITDGSGSDALLTGATKDTGIRIDTTAPLLWSSTPADDALNVKLGSNIVLVFNETVKAGSGNIVIHTTSDGSAVTTIAVTDTSQVSVNTYTFIYPKNAFDSGTGYYITVDPGAFVDLAGNPFAGIASATTLNFVTVPIVNITTNTTLTSVIAPPAGYDYVTYAVGSGATLTLAPNLSTTFKVDLLAASGSGSLISYATITTTGAAIGGSAETNVGGVRVTNNGSITATLASGYYAIESSGLGAITNNGTIIANGGGGIDCWGVLFTNSGTITADETVLYAFDADALNNSGTLHSNHGIGLWAGGSSYVTGFNSGLIYGAKAGLNLQGISFTNSGTITSPGLAVAFDNNATLYNSASGTINGNVGPSALFGFAYAGTTDNAGTINGNVTCTSFRAKPGSIVNGNLVLGDGLFATSFVNTGPGQFAGVTGTVSILAASGTTALWYFVAADASASTLNIPAQFGSLCFDLANNAKLTLTPGTTHFDHIGFAGSGVVDITVNIATASGYPMFDLTQASMQLSGGAIIPTALDFTSRGTLSETHTNTNWYPAMVQLSGQTKFTNAGTITLQDQTSSTSSPLNAVQGFGTVINAGTINLKNADAIANSSLGNSDSGDLTVVNNGMIGRLSGDTTSRGIVSACNVTNTGTISTGGQSVVLGYGKTRAGSLTNSCQITSASNAAVTNAYGANGVSIVNQAAGSISGATYGVYLTAPGGTVTNAGTIAGGTGSVYFGSGGTLVLQTGGILVGDVVGSQYSTNALVLQGNGTLANNFVNFTSLDSQGPGTWTVGGTRSFTTTTVSGGTLLVTGALTSKFTVKAGATLQGSVATLLAQGDVSDNGSVVFDQAVNGSFAAKITGSGSVVKQGAGTLTLGGANNFTGAITITGGTLALSGSIAPSCAVADNGTFDIALTASGTAIQTLSGAGTVALGAKTLTIGNGSTNFSGAIGGTGRLAISGGTQALTGTNTYSGGTVVTGGGMLRINNDLALGAATGGLTLGDAVSVGTLQFVASIDLAATRAITLAAGGGAIDTNGFTTTVSQVISGAGSLTKLGAGALTLAGGTTIPFNTPGAIHVAAGSLTVLGALTGTGTVAVDSGADFTLDATSTSTANIVTIAPTSSGATSLKGGSANDTFRGGAGLDILSGGGGDDTLYGGDEHDTLTGGAGNDTLDGGSNIDTAVFSGNRAAYTITQGATGVFTISGSDGTDTLTAIEYAKFNDQTVRLLPGSGTTIDWSADPSTYMATIRDFDGNDAGSATGWKLIGTADVNGDGTAEHILVNRQNGRWAEVSTEADGKTYLNNYGWAGDTRVVGIYIDPLVTQGTVQAGSDFDSQRRFQNDLNIENIHSILGQGDYNHDGLQEIYFSLTDGTAYLHAYMHADGNIQYANYQNEQQVKDYLTSNGFTSTAWAGWFPASQAPLAAIAGG